MTGTKRKTDSPDDGESSKRVRFTSKEPVNVKPPQTARPKTSDATALPEEQSGRGEDSTGKDKEVDASQPIVQDGRKSAPKHRIVKLAPPRPFPTVPTSASATGPRSARSEGKNQICVTRKTQLGAYLRRCRDVILKDG